jgi:hypothetical protein
MRKTLLLLVLSVFAPVISVLFWPQISEAQQIRQLPANGKRGTTGDPLPLPHVAISRQTLILAPGGLIFDTANRTILHQSLPAGADVWYQINNGGQIQRIYILRPEEQERLNREKK